MAPLITKAVLPFPLDLDEIKSLTCSSLINLLIVMSEFDVCLQENFNSWANLGY